jgi:hypothetical protein
VVISLNNSVETTPRLWKVYSLGQPQLFIYSVKGMINRNGCQPFYRNLFWHQRTLIVTTVQIRNKTERVAGISVQRSICFDFADILLNTRI